MRRLFKVISLMLVLLMTYSSSAFALSQNPRERYEFDKNDKFMQKYYEATKNANTVEELDKALVGLGFIKEKEETAYYEERDGQMVNTGKRRVISLTGTKYYINDKEVSEEEFLGNQSTVTINYANSQLSLGMTTYRGREIDQYITDLLNLVYSFNWSGSKPYQDTFGCYWDDHDVYKTGSSYSTGLSTAATTNTSRMCFVSSSTNSGYINITCKSRDGYVYDDHGAATSEYTHASGAAPNWSFGGSGSLNFVFFSIGFSATYNPQTTLTDDVEDFTF